MFCKIDTEWKLLDKSINRFCIDFLFWCNLDFRDTYYWINQQFLFWKGVWCLFSSRLFGRQFSWTYFWNKYLGCPIWIIGLVRFEEWSWLKIIKFTETIYRTAGFAVFPRVGRTQTLSILFQDCRLRRLPKLLRGAYSNPFRIHKTSFCSSFRVGRTQTLSTKCCAFRCVFCFSSVYKSELLTQPRNKKPCHFRDRVCAQNRNRTCTTLR